MTGQTTNLHLPQWQESDYVLMSEFNAAWLALDGYVDTVNGQLAAQRQELGRQINTANHNILRLVLPQRLAGTYEGTPLTSAYLGLLQEDAEFSECTGFPDFTVIARRGPSWVPGLGLNSAYIFPGQVDSYDGVVRRTINTGGSYSHLTLVLYVGGWRDIDPYDNHCASEAHLQYPLHVAPDFTGLTVSCRVNNTASTSAGWRSSFWPSTVAVPMREYEFYADGQFTGNITVEFPVHCGNDRMMQCYAFAVLMS